MDENYPVRPFVCHCGKVLGEIYRTSNRIILLRVYVRPQNAMIQLFAPKNFIVLDVYDCNVMCGHCNGEKHWYANEQAKEEMVSKLRIRREKVAG